MSWQSVFDVVMYALPTVLGFFGVSAFWAKRAKTKAEIETYASLAFEFAGLVGDATGHQPRTSVWLGHLKRLLSVAGIELTARNESIARAAYAARVAAESAELPTAMVQIAQFGPNFQKSIDTMKTVFDDGPSPDRQGYLRFGVPK